MTTGKRLKQLREERRMTQEELAKALDISKSTVSMYENDTRMPKPENMEAIADFFNVSIDFLYGKSDHTTLLLTEEEREVIMAYRAHPEKREAVRDVLHIRQEAPVSSLNSRKEA